VTTYTVNNLNELTNSARRHGAQSSCSASVLNLLSDGLRYFAYDDENQLISVWVTNVWRSDFLYDGKFRRRIRREYSWQASNTNWLETSEVHYVYDGDVVIQERDGNNLPTISYTRGRDLSGSIGDAGLPRQSGATAGGIGGLLARTDHSILNAQPSSPNAHAFYHADGNGNITALINGAQFLVAAYEYDPFGGILSQIGPLADANLYRFSSKECHVNSGLFYYLDRFYDPNLQRWQNRDPIGEFGGLNLYRFGDNEPLSCIDTFGLTPGTLFPNPVDAGRDAVNTANPISIHNNQETGGLILRNTNGTYVATYPTNGTGVSFDPYAVPVPTGYIKVGDYHCHGDYSTQGANGQPVRTSVPTQDQYNSNNFSTADLQGIDHDNETIRQYNQTHGTDYGYVGVLGTPSGDILEYDPGTGRVSHIGTSPTPNNANVTSPFFYTGANVANPGNQYSPSVPAAGPFTYAGHR
jgi:RHS repeat-associated protein